MNTATKDFSKQTIKALAARGLRVEYVVLLPGKDGSYANGERHYMLSNGCLRNHGEVLFIATMSAAAVSS